jgi:AraC-like DNA-binding protein
VKWEYLVALYSVNESEPTEFAFHDTHFELRVGQSPRLAGLLDQLWHISSQPGGISMFRAQTLFHCALDEVFVSARNQINRGAQELFEKAAAYIHSHYADSLTVRALAKQFNVNENRLAYVFHKYAGMGPGSYLITYRLNRAKERIAILDSTVQEVARSVGYADPYHFSRIFKKQFGFSPSEFRAKFMNNA